MTRRGSDLAERRRSPVGTVALFGALAVAAVVAWQHATRPHSPLAPPRPSAGTTPAVASPPISGRRVPAAMPTPIHRIEEPSPTPAPPPSPSTCPLFDSDPVSITRFPPPRDWLEGASGYEDARRSLRDRPYPILVYFYTDWCGYCRRLESNLLTDYDTERFLADETIRVKINPESGSEEARIAEQFGVGGYPSLFLVMGDRAPEAFSPYEGEQRLMSPGAFEQAVNRRVDQWTSGLLREAEARRRAGDRRAALGILDQLLALRPELAAAYRLRAAVQDEDASPERALEDVRRAIDLMPDDFGAYALADRILSEKQRWGEVAACWGHLLSHDWRGPRRFDALERRIEALARAGDPMRGQREAQVACREGNSRACDLVNRMGG